MSTCTVRARSGAEMPVVTPERASTETVKAVPRGAVFEPCSTIRRRSSRSSIPPSMATQIRPRPCIAMKLIVSEVTNCAGSARSPSFSRSSSSVMISGSPWANASMASSTEQNGDLRRRPPVRRAGRGVFTSVWVEFDAPRASVSVIALRLC